MGTYREVNRCRECGKIYEKGIPYICKKCGTRIACKTPFIFRVLGYGEAMQTDKCERVIAKKTILGWKVEKHIIAENEELVEQQMIVKEARIE